MSQGGPTAFRPRKTVDEMVREAKARVQSLTLEQLQTELAQGEVQLIDVRESRERQKLGWIPLLRAVSSGVPSQAPDENHLVSRFVDPRVSRGPVKGRCGAVR